MLILKVISVVIFVSYAKSDDVKSLRSQKANPDRPLTEIYAAIPVSVVYENKDRKEKSLQSTNTSQNKIKDNSTEAEPNTVASTENNITYKQKSDIFKSIHDRRVNKDNKGNDKESLSVTELQIPVAVIYDEPQENLKIQLNQQHNLRRNHLKRRVIAKKDNNSTEKYIQSREISKSHGKPKTDSPLKKRIRERDPVVPILNSENYVFSHSGDFHYSYESGDGTKASERGELTSGDGNAGEAVVGSFSYIGKDGNDYSLTYTADENGYRPVGAHLPTPPPIPPAIARALEYIASRTTTESDLAT